MSPVDPAHSIARSTGDAAPSPRFGRNPRRARGGFSLIELLVVVGIIIVLAGAAAVALAGRGGDGPALKTAQNLVVGLVGSARAQAALHQTKTRLVIYGQMPPGANVDSMKYLRSLIVLREDLVSGGYVATSDFVTLPAPICIVPPAPVPANHLSLPTGQSWNNNVAMGPVSTLTVENGFRYRGQSTATANQFFGVNGQSGRILYLEFLPDGTVVQPSGVPSGTPVKIALSTAILAGNALPRFNNRETVRGVMIRRTGAISLVRNANEF